MSVISSIVWAAVVAVTAGVTPAVAQISRPAENPPVDDVFLRIEAALDEPRGLCVDIPGHRDRVDVTRPLVVHTCKWGIWNLDERFDAAAVDVGQLVMPAYRLCVGVDTAQHAAHIVLAECDGDVLRSWILVGGQVRIVADPNFCLTVGPEPSRLTPGGRRLPSRHVARSLTLETCREPARERQTWLRVPPRS